MVHQVQSGFDSYNLINSAKEGVLRMRKPRPRSSAQGLSQGQVPRSALPLPSPPVPLPPLPQWAGVSGEEENRALSDTGLPRCWHSRPVLPLPCRTLSPRGFLLMAGWGDPVLPPVASGTVSTRAFLLFRPLLGVQQGLESAPDPSSEPTCPQPRPVLRVPVLSPGLPAPSVILHSIADTTFLSTD